MEQLLAYMPYGYRGMYYDPTYLLVIIGALLCLASSALVQSTFRKYSKVGSQLRMTGADAARRILNYSGITDVRIEQIRGQLTDHYDPRNKVLRLSESVYGSTSIAAIGVAAHECGHAIQHQKGYAPLSLRSALVPLANIGSRLSWPLILIGLLLGALNMGNVLVMAGIALFALAVLFQIVTLPVEFNASGRALTILDTTGILTSQELVGTKKVLRAAAITYIAGAASSILQLLRLLILFGGRRRD